MSKTKRNYQNNKKTRKNKTLKQSGGMDINMILYTLMMLGLIFPISAKVFGINEKIEENKLQNTANVVINNDRSSSDLVPLQTLKTYYFPKTTVLTQVLISPRSNSVDTVKELQEMISNEDIIYFKHHDLARMFKINFEMPSNKPLIKNVDFEQKRLKHKDFHFGDDIYWGIHKDLLEKLLEYLRKPIVDKDMLKFLLDNIEIDEEL